MRFNGQRGSSLGADINGRVCKSTGHFTHRELRLVRCNRRDLDRSRLRRVGSAENRSWHFRDEGQPPGEPSAQFRASAQSDAGPAALVASEFHSRSDALDQNPSYRCPSFPTSRSCWRTYARRHRRRCCAAVSLRIT